VTYKFPTQYSLAFYIISRLRLAYKACISSCPGIFVHTYWEVPETSNAEEIGKASLHTVLARKFFKPVV
jgi:hypothetical protein